MATKHSEYQGAVISIDNAGQFSAVVDGKGLRSSSLKGLKTAIDTKLRVASRLAAAGLKAVVLVQHGRSRYGNYRPSDTTDDWYIGTFDGVDAHTGECYIKLETTGRRVEVGYGFWFRDDDVDGVTEVRRLVLEHRAAEAAAEAAEQRLRASLEAHGKQIGTVHGRERAKAAVAVEQALVEFLGDKKPAAAEA